MMNLPTARSPRLTFRTKIILGSACLMLAQSATALPKSEDLSDLSLEDLMKVEVSSASKFAQSSSQAPSAVQVLTAEDIRRHGWATLAEALDSLPGLYASSDRAFGFLGARGFMIPGDYNMRFLLLMDGQPLNDNVWDQANLGHEFRLDMGMIERIEYVPGPGSSIYGSNAMFGVINVITRSANNLPAWRVGSRLQGDGWRELNLVTSHRSGGDGPDLVFSLSRANKSGRNLRYPDAVGLPTADGSPSPDGMTYQLDKMQVTRAFAGLRQNGLAASVWAARRDVHPSSALFGSNFNDGRLRLIDSSYGLMGSYQRAISQQLDLNLRIAYQKITYQGDAPYLDTVVGSYVSRDEAIGTWLSSEARLLYTGWENHKLIAGVDYQTDLESLQKNADLEVALNSPLAIRTRGNRHAIYLQDEWHFLPDWRLNAGLRSDGYSYGSTNLSPRLALIWNASEHSTLKLLGGRAFRNANTYEANYARAPYYLANPNLASETIRTIEAVGEYKFSNQELGASVFDYQLKNLLQQVDIGNDQLQFQNQAKISAHGLEMFYRLRDKHNMSFMASLAINRSRDSLGQELSNSPKWIAKLRLSRPLWNDALMAAAELNAVGPRTAIWHMQSTPIATQTQLNLALNALKLTPGMELQLRLVNALNSKIAHPASDETGVPSLPMDGRQWQLGLNYAF